MSASFFEDTRTPLFDRWLDEIAELRERERRQPVNHDSIVSGGYQQRSELLARLRSEVNYHPIPPRGYESHLQTLLDGAHDRALSTHPDHQPAAARHKELTARREQLEATLQNMDWRTPLHHVSQAFAEHEAIRFLLEGCFPEHLLRKPDPVAGAEAMRGLRETAVANLRAWADRLSVERARIRLAVAELEQSGAPLRNEIGGLSAPARTLFNDLADIMRAGEDAASCLSVAARTDPRRPRSATPPPSAAGKSSANELRVPIPALTPESTYGEHLDAIRAHQANFPGLYVPLHIDGLDCDEAMKTRLRERFANV